MNQKSPLFREEAIQEYVTTQMHGRLLRISPAWTHWAWWLLLAVLVGALAFATWVPVDTWQQGTGVVLDETDGGIRILALLPADTEEDIQTGVPARAEFLESAAIQVHAVHADPVSPTELHETYPLTRDYLHPEQPSLLVELRAATTAPTGTNGTVQIRTGRTTALRMLLSGWFQ